MNSKFLQVAKRFLAFIFGNRIWDMSKEEIEEIVEKIRSIEL